MQENNLQQFDYTILLTYVQSLCSLFELARFKDILTGLGNQVIRDQHTLTDAHNKLNELREAVQQFRELEACISAKEGSFKLGTALLMSVSAQELKESFKGSGVASAGQTIELIGKNTGVKIRSEDLVLSNYPLWKVIREVLRQTLEIRVYELEEHLQIFGIKAERSAIESALATHRKEFKITKRGREKYVALKGA